MTVLPARVGSRLALSELASLAQAFAGAPDEWIDRVRLRLGKRWYERLERSADHEVWAISWLPHQATGFHDHGGSAGAFAVAFGALEEHRPGVAAQTVSPGQVRAFGPHEIHDVRNAASAPAISIHAYSPPLSIMNRYALAATGLVSCGTVYEDERAADEAVDGSAADPHAGDAAGAGAGGARDASSANGSPRSIDTVLAAARAALRRLSPEQAYDAQRAGAALIDIRPAAQRASEGEVPGALIVERNVLEWRFDPASDARLPEATGYDRQLIVLCSAGYASSLAAVSLQRLGLARATDVIGGFQAWRAEGLPTTRGGASHHHTR